MEAGDPAVLLNNLPFMQDTIDDTPAPGDDAPAPGDDTPAPADDTPDPDGTVDNLSGGAGGGGFGFGGFGSALRPSINGLAGGPGGGFSSSALQSGTTSNPLSLSSGYSGAGGFSGEGLGLFDNGNGQGENCDPCGNQEIIQPEPVIVQPDCGCGVQPTQIIVGDMTYPHVSDAQPIMVDASEVTEGEPPAVEIQSDENATADPNDSSEAIQWADPDQLKLMKKKQPSFLQRFQSFISPGQGAQS